MGELNEENLTLLLLGILHSEGCLFTIVVSARRSLSIKIVG
jgi:hypothetical protein